MMQDIYIGMKHLQHTRNHTLKTVSGNIRMVHMARIWREDTPT